MSKHRKSPLEDATEEIDLRLGGLLGQLGSALNEALSRLDEQGEVHHETTIDSDRGPVRASAGIRIRTLGSAAAKASGRRPENPVNAASPAAPAQSPVAQPAKRDITATILEDERTWRLVAELPGASEGDLVLDAVDGALVIRADARTRRFEGRFPLPQGARASDLRRRMQNGILELTWEKPA